MFRPILVIVFIISIVLGQGVDACAHGEDADLALLCANLEFGGPDLFYVPTAVQRGTDGKVYVLDSGNNRIVVCDSQGRRLSTIGTMGSGPGEFMGMSDLSIGPQGRLYVTDIGNSRIQILEPGGEVVRSLSLDHPSRALAVGEEGRIQVLSDPRVSVDLVRSYPPIGSEWRSFGIVLSPPEGSIGSDIALNRARLLALPGGGTLVAREFLPRIERYDSEGRLITAFHLDGPEVIAQRDWYYQARPEDTVRTDRLGIQSPEPDDYLADILAVSSGSAPHGPVYIGGVGFFHDEIYILVRGVLQAYSDSGHLLRRLDLVGPFGEEIFVHYVSVADDGTVFGLDTYHSFKCYRFKLSDDGDVRMSH